MATLKGTDLEEWWRSVSEADYRGAGAKAQEYGSSGQDLVDIGRDMASMMSAGVPEGVEPDQWYAELGILFYLRGKVSRSFEAFRRGRLPSDDTYLDTTVYSMMARRVRQTGRWG